MALRVLSLLCYLAVGKPTTRTVGEPNDYWAGLKQTVANTGTISLTTLGCVVGTQKRIAFCALWIVSD